MHTACKKHMDMFVTVYNLYCSGKIELKDVQQNCKWHPWFVTFSSFDILTVLAKC